MHSRAPPLVMPCPHAALFSIPIPGAADMSADALLASSSAAAETDGGRHPVVLAVAGSEATGGAGAQTDLRTLNRLGCYGVVALTCIVSFDPKADWAHRFLPIPPRVIREQIEAATAIHEIDTVKIGMLGSTETIDAVAASLAARTWRHVVVDPVLICKEGERSGPASDVDDELMEAIMPLASVVTPNLGEARILSGLPAIDGVEDLERAGRIIAERWGTAVLIKGGMELPGPDAVDLLIDGDEVTELRGPKLGDRLVSGAGCTLASALTAELAQGASMREAARVAKAVVTSAIEHRRSGPAPFDAVDQGYYEA